MQKYIIAAAAGVIVLAVLWYVFSGGRKSAPSQQSTTIPSETEDMQQKSYSSPPPLTIDPTKTYTVTMTTTKGVMKFTLFPRETPKTVNNFVFLARDGFYTNTVFHRIIKGFMIQGGDPRGDGSGGPGYRFDDEPVTRDYNRGTLAMANAGPNTNGSQFFIMHADYALPKNYVIFGMIEPTDSASLATLDAIANIPVGLSASGEMSRPLDRVAISSIMVEEK